MTIDAAPDALLLLSFGGPEGPDDVLPFLRNVTRGRGVPDERLAVVARQYERFGGRSPINDQCRALLAALGPELADHGLNLPLYWGNRNWHPYLADTVQAMAADGVRHALVFATSAFGSYSGCRQYRDDLARAAEAVGDGAPQLSKLRLFYNHPGFIEPVADRLVTALGDGGAEGTRIVFTAHSIPVSMAAGCSYEAQLRQAAGLVLAAAGLPGAEETAAGLPGAEETAAGTGPEVVYQSRSGPPAVPWLEPDVNDHLRALAADGVGRVALVPLGFISDHMEVLYDLDTQARETATEVGIDLVRVPTVGTHPRFVAMIRELVAERVRGAERLALGPDGPWPDECPAGHCPAPAGRPG